MKEISYAEDVNKAPLCHTYAHKTRHALALFEVKAALKGEFRRQYCADCTIEYVRNVVKDLKEHGEL